MALSDGSSLRFPLDGKNDFPDYPPRWYLPGDPRNGDPRFIRDTTAVDPKVKEEYLRNRKNLKSMMKEEAVRLKDIVGEFSKEEESEVEGDGLTPYGRLLFIYHRRRKLQEQEELIKKEEELIKIGTSYEELRWESYQSGIKGGVTPRPPDIQIVDPLSCSWCRKCRFYIKTLMLRLESIKMVRNYVENYMKKWVADLIKGEMDPIESGRFFLEGVLVEQNMSACYALTGEFLDSISNVPAMHDDDQSDCPDESKEAVASLMYAAARFSELPELQNLRNIFTEKYGNSLEAFVNKEFVERLRWSNAPTEEMKVQLVCEIAKEFSIELDSKALEQKQFTPIPADQGHPRHAFPGCIGLQFSEFHREMWYSKFKFNIKTLRVRLEAIRRRKSNVVQDYLKKCVAGLLVSGMDPNKYGMADGVLVEQNMSACFALTKKFLDYISLYMGYQSECPEECPSVCKEAVASLMCAAARFSDLPELQNLRNIFTEKYGNSLDALVNKEFVERLNAPTEEMKVQLVHDVAKEFSIEWDSKEGFGTKIVYSSFKRPRANLREVLKCAILGSTVH